MKASVVYSTGAFILGVIYLDCNRPGKRMLRENITHNNKDILHYKQILITLLLVLLFYILDRLIASLTRI